MSATISNNGLPPQLPQVSGNPGSGGAAGAAGTDAGTGSGAAAVGHGTDQVKLTDSARALQQAARPDNGSAIDTKRVDQVRAAIASGSYQINPGNIADRLISLDHQLGGTGKA
ncbi:MAG: flagellar biosynthesis anti-sigma factor FlgM [Rhodanobacter sp.]|nr:MAG: flagellar biosynthesis anti-sigma factor FlgM [Rhodanobacter sp.]TAM13987.1 MAG: flagellar biosynthesis anti-sigma factor FlgM [Rhodanobacter sp.]TAM37162.1 MAG: flagellar biosynthesis anti-sigma factor FlgM [Rhodanobacter sp.]